MKGYSENFGISLKSFKKFNRHPPSLSKKIECINVYKHSKSLSMSSVNIHSVLTKDNIRNSEILTHQPTPTPSLTKSFKLRESSDPPLNHTLKTPQKKSIFKTQKQDFDFLSKISQKKSIIYNQVKTFVKQKAYKKIITSTKELIIPNTGKKIVNEFKKLGTMKRALFEDDSGGEAYQFEEEEQEVIVREKRKKLKSHVWRWVGANGSIVY